MTEPRIDLPLGTLDLLILSAFSLGRQHGWAISERVQKVSRDVLRIQHEEPTRSAQRQFPGERYAWERVTAAIAEVLRAV